MSLCLAFEQRFIYAIRGVKQSEGAALSTKEDFEAEEVMYEIGDEL